MMIWRVSRLRWAARTVLTRRSSTPSRGIRPNRQGARGGNEGLDEASKLFDELASQVPDEIKADFEVIAENFSKIAEALKDVDLASGETPSAEDVAKLQELTSSLNSTEVQQASENIQAWAEENC